MLSSMPRSANTSRITGPDSPTNADPFPVTIDFGETVTDLTVDDIAVTGGTVSGLVDDGNGLFTATIDAAADEPVSEN